MEPLTPGQEKFAGVVARETGLDPRVIGAWVKSEQSGSAAEYYDNKNYHNYLNIANTDSGPASGAHSSVWSNPETAGKATAEWMRGRGRIAGEYGRPAAGIMAILKYAGKSPQEQIEAIGRSGWATAPDYGSKIGTLYHELSGHQLALISAVQRAAGAKAGIAPVIPEGSHATPAAPAENPIDAITAIHTGAVSPGTDSSMISKNWELLKSLFDPTTPITQRPEGKAPEMLLPGEEPAVGSSRALAWATAHLGKFAETSGPNLGPELNKLEQQFGMTGEPWCAIFATTVASQGGMPREGRTASVAEINTWAQEGSHGYQRGLKPSSQARPGDLLTFGDQHVAVVKEVKGDQIITIEGNADGSGGVVQLSHRIGEGQIARPSYRSH
jgi:hypothetical protein